MNTESFEYEKMKDGTTLPEIVRKSFRVPVEDSKNIWVVIDNKRYAVLDICVEGIGIALKKNSVFCVDQVLTDCELFISDLSIKELNGQIIHFTSSNDEEDWHCGIQWMDMKENLINQISDILSTMKEQLLKDDNFLFDEE